MKRAEPVGPGQALIIGKRRSRQITAGADGVRYLSVHRRRGPLQISRLPAGGADDRR